MTGVIRFLIAAAFVCSASSEPNGLRVYTTCNNVKYEWGWQYACTVRDFRVERPDVYVEDVVATHLPGKDQYDVEAVHIENQVARYLPARFEVIYMNMITYRVENSGLRTLGNINFYRKLRYLVLDYNLIEEVPTEAFRETRDLEWISMENNRIEELDKDLFKNMPKLRFVFFAGNRLHRLNDELFMNNPNMEEMNFNRNEIEIIGNDLVRDLRKLKIANFDMNDCINDAYYGDQPRMIENLTQHFMRYCSGECVNTNNADNEMKRIEAENRQMIEQNRIHKVAKSLFCKRRQMMASSSSSESSE